MIIDIDGVVYQSKNAITEIEKLLGNQIRYDGIMKFCMSNTRIRELGYPIAKIVRRMLLLFKYIKESLC